MRLPSILVLWLRLSLGRGFGREALVGGFTEVVGVRYATIALTEMGGGELAEDLDPRALDRCILCRTSHCTCALRVAVGGDVTSEANLGRVVLR